jgi:hypothetical protein
MARWSDGFLAQWCSIDEMTLAFVDGVPDKHFAFSPHERFAPFCKQLRHVVCVRGVYNEAITNGRTDFARKHEHYSGDLSRPQLRAALVEKQKQLLALFDEPLAADQSREIDLFGRPFTLAQYTYVMTQHEALHHGEWALYASLAGFETPSLWRLRWGL